MKANQFSGVVEHESTGMMNKHKVGLDWTELEPASGETILHVHVLELFHDL